MKKLLSGILSLMIILSFVSQSSTAFAIDATNALTSDEVTVTNNVGKADTIYAIDVMGGDIVNVYNAATGGKLIGKGTVGVNKSDLTISIAQLGISAGSVYISDTSKGMSESSRTEVDYAAEAVSDDPLASNITITNNTGMPDTIYVCGLIPSDIIKIYNKATGGSLMGTATVGPDTTDVTKSFVQLGANGGSIYISVTSLGMRESNRVEADFLPESYTTAPLVGNIIITNNVGKASTVDVSGLLPGDIIKIYTVAIGNVLLGTATVGSNASEVIKSFNQLSAVGGTLYISDTTKGMHESTRTPMVFSAENQSNLIQSANVTITNNTEKADTIYVDGLSGSDKVNVYTTPSGVTPIATGTVVASGSDITISIAKLGKNAGTVYLSDTSLGMLESARTVVAYSGENQSTSVYPTNIVVTNNAGMADTVYAYDLSSGDVINVYDSLTGGNLLGTATAVGNNANVSISQLGTSAGIVYVSVTNLNKLESARTAVTYSGENQSTSTSPTNIVVTNNAGIADTVYADDLSSGDVIKVYDSLTGGNLLGTATALGNNATVSISQLGTSAGTVYVSVTSLNNLESTRVPISYTAEGQSTLTSPTNIVVTNNAGIADTVYADDLSSGDVIKVYDSLTGGNLLGTATALGNNATVSISQLGTSAGTVYVSVTSLNNLESTRIPISYSAEGQSTLITSDDISVSNNVGIADTVYVSDLSAGDVINVYDAQIGGNLLGTATVGANATDGTVGISQLGTSAGTIYVSITSTNRLESSRVSAAYTGQGQSTTIDSNNIIVSNNSGKPDTVYVSILNAGDVINVYDSASGGNLLGTATVAASGTNVTVSIPQLDISGGSVYVSVTSTNKIKSVRTQATYSAVGSSTSITASNIVITNNAGQPDTVQVDGLSADDIINVYNEAQGGNLLGTATVGQYSSNATITIDQLGSGSGNVYVSVTSPNDVESARIDGSYAAESESTAINTANISITNNSGAPDIINVTGLSANDIVNVYNLGQGGTLLGTATVAAGGTTATISILQLGTTAGSVYISVTSTDKLESARTLVNYSEEPISDTPAASNIVVTNNAGLADTVVVTGLSATDVVNVYDSATGGTLLGTETVANYATSATVSINQLGTGAGSVYISVTSASKLQSSRTQIGFSAEAQSVAPVASNVIVVNKAGIAGTVTINGVSGGNIINVYDAAQGGNLLGTATVGTYNTSSIISVNQLGSSAGNVYVSYTSTGQLESNRTEVDYSAKLVSSTPNAANITVVNNATIAGTVAVVGLQPNDVVNIYDSAINGNLLTTATVPSDSTTLTLSLTQLAINGGNIYVSVQSTGQTESATTQVAYNPVLQSTAPTVGNIVVVNNSGIPDTINVTGISSNDIINVYSAATGGTLLGTATVANGASDATISVSQLGTTAGSVYVSVITYGDTASARTEADYVSESTAPISENVSIVNNAVLPDTVTVNDLTANDVVNVYDSVNNGNLLGSAVVAANSTSTTVTIPQLTTTAGSAYITVTNFGKSESDRTKVNYIAEQNSTPIFAGNVNIVNNTVGTPDTIAVSNLTPTSLVKVYDASTGGNLIGIATVSSNATQVTITIPQLSIYAGSVYLSVTTPGKNESSRTEADYIAEN